MSAPPVSKTGSLLIRASGRENRQAMYAKTRNTLRYLSFDSPITDILYSGRNGHAVASACQRDNSFQDCSILDSNSC